MGSDSKTIYAVGIAPASAQAGTATSLPNGAISSELTPIDTSTGSFGNGMVVQSAVDSWAFSPDGSTLYVVDALRNSLTSVNLASGQTGPVITLGQSPQGTSQDPSTAVSISPDGQTALVSTPAAGLEAVELNGRNSNQVQLPPGASALASCFSHDGKSAYVLVTPANGQPIGIESLQTSNWQVQSGPVPLDLGVVGPDPRATITPQSTGTSVFVTSDGDNQVSALQVMVPSLAPQPVSLQLTAGSFARIVPSLDGSYLFALDSSTSSVFAVDLSTGIRSKPVSIGSSLDYDRLLPSTVP